VDGPDVRKQPAEVSVILLDGRPRRCMMKQSSPVRESRRPASLDSPRPLREAHREQVMKAHSVLWTSTALLALVLLVGCSRANEKLYYGTFTGDKIPQKTVRAPGSFKDYSSITDSDPAEEGTEKIVKAWTDSEGNTWFQTYSTITTEGDYKDTKEQTLARISKAGTVLEFNWTIVSDFSPKNFPRKIDKTLATNYRIYNRVEN
jgi:hypothetical protein